ncbi:MAG: hypothetical protein PVF89_04015, partial [Lysobacterales bacterium]
MNDKWKMLAIAGLLLSSAAAFAQKDAAKTADPADAPKSADPAAPPPIPPIPPKVPNEEPAPTVTITEKHGER